MALHSTPVHSSPLHATPRHSTPLHSTPLHSTPLHSTPLHSLISRLAGFPPFREKNRMKLYSKIVQCNIEFPDSHFSSVSVEGNVEIFFLCCVQLSLPSPSLPFPSLPFLPNSSLTLPGKD